MENPATARARCEAAMKSRYLFFDLMHIRSSNANIVAETEKGTSVRLPIYAPARYAAEYVIHPLSITSFQ